MNSLELGEYPNPCESQYNIGVSLLEHRHGGRSKNISSGEIREKG